MGKKKRRLRVEYMSNLDINDFLAFVSKMDKNLYLSTSK